MVYDKTLGLHPEDLENSAAVTLMGTDIERIAYNLKQIHELWSSIVEIAIALWLLGRQVGVACVIPLVVSIGTIAHSIVDTVHATNIHSNSLCWSNGSHLLSIRRGSETMDRTCAEKIGNYIDYAWRY